MCRDNLTASVVLRASAVNNRFRICKDVVKKPTGQCLEYLFVGYYMEMSRI